jgi:hypothetical protein
VHTECTSVAPDAIDPLCDRHQAGHIAAAGLEECTGELARALSSVRRGSGCGRRDVEAQRRRQELDLVVGVQEPMEDREGVHRRECERDERGGAGVGLRERGQKCAGGEEDEVVGGEEGGVGARGGLAARGDGEDVGGCGGRGRDGDRSRQGRPGCRCGQVRSEGLYCCKHAVLCISTDVIDAYEGGKTY